MIEVRFFSTLREGRGKITPVPAGETVTAGNHLRRFETPSEEVAILLINGFHSKPENAVEDGDVISPFPEEESLQEAELFSRKGKPATRRANFCRFIEKGHCFLRRDGDVPPCMGPLHTADTYLGEHKRRIRHHAFGNVSGQCPGEI